MIHLRDKKILITGSQGFIGKHLLNELLPKCKIIGINSIYDKKTKNYIPLKKNIVKLKASDVSSNLTGIVHLAAITDVNFCQQNPQKCFETNVLGTQKTLEVARKKDCKFVYVSTSHVYGKPEKLPLKEEHQKNPNSIYAASKLAGEICCEGYARSYGMDISIVRLFSVYGPNSPTHLVTSRIISQLDKPSIKLGNLRPKRDFIFVTDAIKAIATVLKKSQNFKVYNVGTGKSYSILDICNIIGNLSGEELRIKKVNSYVRKTEIDEIISDITKIKKLGWKPRIDIKQGLKITLEKFLS